MSKLCFKKRKQGSLLKDQGIAPFKKSFIPFNKLITKPIIINNKLDDRYFVDVDILGVNLSGLLDSGANRTVLGAGYEKLFPNLKIIPSEFASVMTAGGEDHIVIGVVEVPFKLGKELHIVPTLLVPSIKSSLILGVDFWRKFSIRPQIFLDSVSHDSVINNLEHDLNDEEKRLLFSAVSEFPTKKPGILNKTNVLEHNIDTGSAVPIKQRHHIWSPYVHEKVIDEVRRMLSLGVIEPSYSSWNNPVVVVPKPNGKLRLCLDSRKLNSVSKPDAFPMPHINRILGRFRSTKFLSTVDLTDAFWQIPLNEESKEKTAFTIPGFGLLQFNRLPFGLHNAAQSLSRCIEKVIGFDLEPNVFVYLDDIVISSETFEEHLNLINIVASRLKAANLTINVEKSKFCRKSLKYLGYVISENGLHLDRDKIAPILDYSIPTTVKEVRRLIGMAGWYRRFIPNFAEISSPITDLIKKGKKLIWTAGAQVAFEKLKTALVSAPILANPDFNKPFYVQTDASDYAVAGVLFQVNGEGNEQVIAYFSQKLTNTQKVYAVTEKEALAVLLSIEKFRPYIEGVHFTVITDHASLLWLTKLQNPTGRLGRWALKLQQYNVSYQHRPGKNNVVPDALSRSIAIDSVALNTSSNTFNSLNSLKNSVSKYPEKYPDFRVENGVLLKHIIDMSPLGDYYFGWRVVVSDNEKADILKKCHDDVRAGHFGFFKTLSRIRENYFWPKMYSDVKSYVSACDICKAIKSTTQATKAPMGAQKVARRPWQIVSIDFLGPFTRSKQGNTVLFVVIDWFSKFILLQPMRKATTRLVIKYLEDQIFSVYGVPEKIVSDNGSQFTAKDFKTFVQDYSVKHWLNASYHAQTNHSERSNKVILSTIRAFIKADHRNWDENLAKIGCAIRTAVHESTKFSPYAVNFGYNMILSGEEHSKLDKILYSTSPNLVPNDINDFVFDKQNLLRELREDVQKHMKEAYNRYSKYYNLRARPRVFQKGDVVWKKNFNLSDASKNISAKLNPQRVKCIVKKRVGTNTYELEDGTGKRLGIFHLKDIST